MKFDWVVVQYLIQFFAQPTLFPTIPSVSCSFSLILTTLSRDQHPSRRRTSLRARRRTSNLLPVGLHFHSEVAYISRQSHGSIHCTNEKVLHSTTVQWESAYLISLFGKMPEDNCSERPLFGGAISSTFPLRFQDVSNIRQVPDHQEVFVDPARDESLIFELLDLKHDVSDNGSAAWFLQDLATEQDAEGSMVIEQSGVFEVNGLNYRNIPAVITTVVGQMAISKGRQGREAQNIVRVYLANLRLKGVGTDVLITAYEPILINPLSESASTVGAGLAVPASQSGCMRMAEIFKLAVSSFKVNDWSLFGAAA